MPSALVFTTLEVCYCQNCFVRTVSGLALLSVRNFLRISDRVLAWEGVPDWVSFLLASQCFTFWSVRCASGFYEPVREVSLFGESLALWGHIHLFLLCLGFQVRIFRVWLGS